MVTAQGERKRRRRPGETPEPEPDRGSGIQTDERRSGRLAGLRTEPSEPEPEKERTSEAFDQVEVEFAAVLAFAQSLARSLDRTEKDGGDRGNPRGRHLRTRTQAKGR